MPLSSRGRSVRNAFAARLDAHRRFKRWAVPAFIAVFFAGYFLVLKLPVFPVTVMPLTAVDRFVSFQPVALFLYISLWVYVPLSFVLLPDRREIVRYGWSVTGLAAVGLAIFLLWPTTIPPLDLDWSQHPAFVGLKSIDASGNACPSLHVAFAVLSAMWLQRELREMGDRGFLRVLSWLWCAGILYSTLATKQHVALDVAAGGVLGAAVAAVGLRQPSGAAAEVAARRSP